MNYFKKMFKNKKPSTIIFDLDGTLVDSSPDLSATLNHLLRKNNRPEIPPEKIRQMVGKGAKALIQKGFSKSGDMPSEVELTKLFNEFIDYYYHNIAVKTKIFPSLIQVLEELKSYNIPLGVCTNKTLKLSEKLLKDLELFDYFSVLTGSDSFKYMKPDPRHILSTLSIIKADPKKAIMVGDSSNDIIAAQQAGISSIGVTFGYTDKHISEYNPTQTIDHYDDFINAAILIMNDL